MCVFSLDPRRIARLSAIVTGFAILVAGTLQVVTGHEVTDLAIYGSSIAYHTVIISIPSSFVLRAREVETEVLLVAATLYLALGTGFLPISSSGSKPGRSYPVAAHRSSGANSCTSAT